MNLFDHYADKVFQVVQTTMGYLCVWVPSSGAATREQTVLLNEPTENQKLGFVAQGYENVNSVMEYQEAQLPELEKSVRNGGSEYVTVNGTRYYVHHVERKYDGRTLMAYMQEDNE